jgi:predicted nucleic acid-binding protein
VLDLYLDTSALARVLLRHPDTSLIGAEIDRFDGYFASRLLRTELRRVALRNDLLEFVDPLLTEVSLVPIDESILIAAETIRPATIKTLDAIHLATIVRLAEIGSVDAVMTYDARLAEAVRERGLEVVAPV